jgi:hypothetical protein
MIHPHVPYSFVGFHYKFLITYKKHDILLQAWVGTTVKLALIALL